MATGSGKTIVMAMLIAWQVLNKVAAPRDKRFTKRFLVVTPGLTIRDRLRALLPGDPDNHYRLRDLVPAELHGGLGQAQIVITNYHAFLARENGPTRSAATTAKDTVVPAATTAAPGFPNSTAGSPETAVTALLLSSGTQEHRAREGRADRTSHARDLERPWREPHPLRQDLDVDSPQTAVRADPHVREVAALAQVNDIRAGLSGSGPADPGGRG